MTKGYYHRSFVILQPRDLKFNIKSEKPATGYCKIEVRNDKCKMYFHVQDLKPRGAEQGGYDIFLVSAQEGILPQKIASIYVDQRGRGECTVEIDVNEVSGSGYSLEQFHGLAVVCNDHGDISYPLVGYANKRVELDWEGRIKRDLGRLYNKSIKPTVESKKGSSPTKLVEEKKSEGSKKEISFSMDDKQDNKQKTLQDIIVALGPLLQSRRQENEMGNDKVQAEQAKEKEDMDVVKGLAGDSEGPKGSIMVEKEKKKAEVQGVEDSSISEKLQGMTGAQPSGIDGENIEGLLEGMSHEQDIEKDAAEDMGSSDVQNQGPNLLERQTYWDKTKEYYAWLFETYRKVYPFIVEMGEIEWVEVPCEDGYGHYGYIASQYIGSNYYYDHYIVGVVRENGQVRYVAYGVPGPYCPVSFMQGFSRWVPSRYGFGMGYWLLYIDACTGEIAYLC